MKNILQEINVTIHVKILWYVMLKLSKITYAKPIDLYISKLKLLLTN